ncbi:spore germination protein [Sediminibacillus albus]|uniref:Spore germination protein KA n=1 Tax=Sediminibacillus albus TaxID=407036 RepID=A0A1G9A8M5_9BACI|nr:spore germination protein [Sediminibacillus albus]SDK23706.1 spore germination protein KA [Sediminibacillus albus]
MFFKKKKQTEDPKEVPISNSLEKNTKHLKQLFSFGLNKDFSVREITARYSNKKINLFFYSSIVNSTKIHEGIIRPLLEAQGDDLTTIITLENIKESKDFGEVVDDINSGNIVLFLEDSNKAFSVNVADFQHRGIEKPENENAVKAPKEAFTESLYVNISLIRKRFHDKQLIAEAKPVGARSKLDVTVMYIKDVVNNEVLENVRERLDNLTIDNVRNIESLEQYIEDRPYSIVSSLLYTERPDRAASYLEDGYIVLLMENSSACLILPVTFWSFFHSEEDRYLRFLFGNFSRLIRFLAFLISLLISAVYVSVTNYHNEMIPPDLLLAIVSARERVPFPVVFEIMLMEVSFELIREAGLRIPNPLGPTIGIVGALIIGQAAVEANIVSPIVVIIVALSGLSSFAVANISMNYTIRLTRFIFIFSAAFFGMLTLTGAFLLWVMYLASLRSFGVPFLAPLSPNFQSNRDTIFRKMIKNEYFRPGQLKPKDMRKKG